MVYFFNTQLNFVSVFLLFSQSNNFVRIFGLFQIFPGNKDRNTLKENLFIPPFRARYVRIYPWTWVGHISMRAEFYVRKICKYLPTDSIFIDPVWKRLGITLIQILIKTYVTGKGSLQYSLSELPKLF